jgi:hypothetical protein
MFPTSGGWFLTSLLMIPVIRVIIQTNSMWFGSRR